MGVRLKTCALCHKKKMVGRTKKRCKSNREREKVARPVQPLPCKPTGETWNTYEEYLKTDWWRKRRLRSFILTGDKCNRCNATTNLQAHHKTYARIGKELDSDLEVLCRFCHLAEHGLL